MHHIIKILNKIIWIALIIFYIFMRSSDYDICMFCFIARNIDNKPSKQLV